MPEVTPDSLRDVSEYVGSSFVTLSRSNPAFAKESSSVIEALRVSPPLAVDPPLVTSGG